MEEYKAAKSESHKRILAISILLAMWTVGISVLISLLSPIEELVRNSPVALEDQSIVKEKLERLEVQSRITGELSSKARDLADDYGDAVNFLKNRLLNVPKTKDGFLELLSIIGSSNENPRIRTAYSNRVISVHIETVEGEGGAYVPKSIYLVSRDVDIEVKAEPEGAEYPQNISYLAIHSPKGMLENRVEIVSTASDSKLVQILEITDPKLIGDGIPAYGDEFDKVRSLRGLIQNPTEGTRLAVNLSNENSVEKIFNNVIDSLESTQKKMNNVYLKYSSLSEKMQSTSDDLESRLLSSTALFAVISFRASLIVIVFVSIGFILVRALSSELVQARRISYTQIGHTFLKEQDAEKLNHVTQTFSAISGENVDKIEKNADLPLATQLVEKTGEAISRIVNKTG